jgi:hypothetical protein
MNTPLPWVRWSLKKVVTTALKTLVLLISTLKHNSILITTSRLYVSTKLQNSKVFLQIVLQLTCSKASDLPSLLHVDVVTGDYTHCSASVSLLASFVITASPSSFSHNKHHLLLDFRVPH